MGKRLIDGENFKAMLTTAEETLRDRVDIVNDLNVFPVPDGDTGSNMHQTLAAGTKAGAVVTENHAGVVAKAFANGLLLGARGNSGVILSQLFRGFAEITADLQSVNGKQLANAFEAGVDAAYAAVLKPVEGTILTVAREAAKHAVKVAKKEDDAVAVMMELRDKAQETLSKTTEMLDILREVGVVDSGGQGLVFIYDGFVRALTGEASEVNPIDVMARPAVLAGSHKAQAQIETDAIDFFYDMEFFIDVGKADKVGSAVKSLRRALRRLGDSILVVPTDALIKIHVHTEAPGEVLTLALKHGELRQIQIENMRDQHREYIGAAAKAAGRTSTKRTNVGTCSLITVVSGAGLTEVFESIGVEEVMPGGQTMNPSIDDWLQAIKRAKGDQCILLPNNSNILMSAQQAQKLSKTKKVEVVPTTSIQQGIGAALAYQANVPMVDNVKTMIEAMELVKSGQVTYATRDTKQQGLQIKQGDFIGLTESAIVAAGHDILEICGTVTAKLIEDETEILTVFTGEESDPNLNEQLMDQLEQLYPEIDIEMIAGGQPLYYYLFSAE